MMDTKYPDTVYLNKDLQFRDRWMNILAAPVGETYAENWGAVKLDLPKDITTTHSINVDYDPTYMPPGHCFGHLTGRVLSNRACTNCMLSEKDMTGHCCCIWRSGLTSDINDPRPPQVPNWWEKIRSRREAYQIVRERDFKRIEKAREVWDPELGCCDCAVFGFPCTNCAVTNYKGMLGPGWGITPDGKRGLVIANRYLWCNRYTYAFILRRMLERCHTGPDGCYFRKENGEYVVIGRSEEYYIYIMHLCGMDGVFAFGIRKIIAGYSVIPVFVS